MEKVNDLVQIIQKKENVGELNQFLNMKENTDFQPDTEMCVNNKKTKNDNKIISSLKKRNESNYNLDNTVITENSKKVSFCDQESIISINKYSNSNSKKHPSSS